MNNSKKKVEKFVDNEGLRILRNPNTNYIETEKS